MDHRQVHNSVGSIAIVTLPTEIIMVGHHLRIIDSSNRPSGRPSYSRYNQSYQQESYRGNGNSRGYYQSESYSEPEPEWMQFGPSSRTELLELGGEDEIEKMKEGTYCIAQKLDGKILINLMNQHCIVIIFSINILQF